VRRLAALPIVLTLAWSAAAHAKEFTVNTNGDQPDAVGDARCDVDLGAAARQCTLRAAISEANDQTDTDVIDFDIPGAGVHKIKLLGPGLPTILQPVSIEGYTQPGSQPNTDDKGSNAVINVWIDSADEPDGCNQTGLTINTHNTTVEGLAITNFQACTGGGDGIRIVGTSGNNLNVIRGNFIGIKPDGLTARPNGAYGVDIGSGTAFNVVGGSGSADRNILSANFAGAYVAQDQGAVTNNLIGTDRTGKQDAGNFGSGIELHGDGNDIESNAIAFNGFNGITAPTGLLNTFSANSIFYNDGLGIDLGDDGVTINDYGPPRDLDSGANGLQNFPELGRPTTDAAGTTKLDVSLLSEANKAYTVQIFSGPPGTSQGKKLVHQMVLTTDAMGNSVQFGAVLSQTVPVGDVLTATATSPGGDTSEFSFPRQVRRASG
jgi:CSLREA domain-containing protein